MFCFAVRLARFLSVVALLLVALVANSAVAQGPDLSSTSWEGEIGAGSQVRLELYQAAPGQPVTGRLYLPDFGEEPPDWWKVGMRADGDYDGRQMALRARFTTGPFIDPPDALVYHMTLEANADGTRLLGQTDARWHPDLQELRAIFGEASGPSDFRRAGSAGATTTGQPGGFGGGGSGGFRPSLPTLQAAAPVGIAVGGGLLGLLGGLAVGSLVYGSPSVPRLSPPGSDNTSEQWRRHCEKLREEVDSREAEYRRRLAIIEEVRAALAEADNFKGGVKLLEYSHRVLDFAELRLNDMRVIRGLALPASAPFEFAWKIIQNGLAGLDNVHQILSSTGGGTILGGLGILSQQYTSRVYRLVDVFAGAFNRIARLLKIGLKMTAGGIGYAASVTGYYVAAAPFIGTFMAEIDAEMHALWKSIEEQRQAAREFAHKLNEAREKLQQVKRKHAHERITHQDMDALRREINWFKKMRHQNCRQFGAPPVHDGPSMSTPKPLDGAPADWLAYQVGY